MGFEGSYRAYGPGHSPKMNSSSLHGIPRLRSGRRRVVRPTEGLFFRRLVEEIKILAVASLLHLRDRHEAESRGIEAITHSGRLWAVVKNVAEVGVALFGADFRAFHEKRLISFLNDMRRIDWLGEALPAGGALELVGRSEELLTANQVDVDAGFVVVPVSVVESRLGAVFAGDVVLLGSQF